VADQARLTSLREIPPVSIKAPARMKKGTARSGKESQPVKIFCGTMTRGTFPFSRSPIIDASPMLNAIGTLTATKPRKVRLRIIPICQPDT